MDEGLSPWLGGRSSDFTETPHPSCPTDTHAAQITAADDDRCYLAYNPDKNFRHPWQMSGYTPILGHT